MKVERMEVVPVFEPIVITIESLDELRWFLAIANTSVGQAREQVRNQGFELREDAHIEQMNFWNSLVSHRNLVQ